MPETSLKTQTFESGLVRFPAPGILGFDINVLAAARQ
jgi:hypothetical protein